MLFLKCVILFKQVANAIVPAILTMELLNFQGDYATIKEAYLRAGKTDSNNIEQEVSKKLQNLPRGKKSRERADNYISIDTYKLEWKHKLLRLCLKINLS